MTLRPRCDWCYHLDLFPARFRNVHRGLNCCQSPKCRAWLSGGWPAKDDSRIGGWQRITVPRLVQWNLVRLLKLCADISQQIFLALAQVVAGRFWADPRPKDYEVTMKEAL